MLPEMADAAAAALAYLDQLQPELRAAAILDRSDAVMAAVGFNNGWQAQTERLITLIDSDRVAREAHVATQSGEIFLVREGEFALLAVTHRFVLASLVSFDMRTVLRDLIRGSK